NFSIHIIGGAPNSRLEIVLPVFLPGLGIQAMEIPVILADVNQAVVDGGSAHGGAKGHGPAPFGPGLEVAAKCPNESGSLILRRLDIQAFGRDIAGLRDVDAQEVAKPPRRLTIGE